MARQVRFGTVDLPSTFAPAEDSLAFTLEPAKHLRQDGARIIQEYAGEKVIPIRGTLIKGPISNLGAYNDLRSAVDALRAQLATGPQPLYFWDDRYYRQVRRRGLSVSYVEKRYENIANIEIEFVTGDPYQYYHSSTNNVWAAPASNTTQVITTGGNASASPIYKLTTGSASINWTITNQTTGIAFTILGTGLTPGDIIVVDTLAKTVVIGSTDEMDLFDGEFPLLSNGANTLHNLQTLGTLTRLETIWQNRWHG